jgi:hypothetical protein
MFKKIICILLGHVFLTENIDSSGFSIDLWGIPSIENFIHIERCKRCKKIGSIKIIKENEIVKKIKG